jgi:hypothetical protein
MAISYQTLKEILESFKAQLFHTLDDRLDAFVHVLTDDLTDRLNDTFRSIQYSLNNMQERLLMWGGRGPIVIIVEVIQCKVD